MTRDEIDRVAKAIATSLPAQPAWSDFRTASQRAINALRNMPVNKPQGGITHIFASTARYAAIATGSPWSFVVSMVLIICWIASGPFCHWSDTWQLLINTTTTIITFLLVFIIQHTQNRDTEAIQAKLDELIRSNRDADDAKIGIERD